MIRLVVNKDRPVIYPFKDTVGIPIGVGIFVIYPSELIKVVLKNLFNAVTIFLRRISIEEKRVIPVLLNTLEAMVCKEMDCFLIVSRKTEISRISGKFCFNSFYQLCQCLLCATADIKLIQLEIFVLRNPIIRNPAFNISIHTK